MVEKECIAVNGGYEAECKLGRGFFVGKRGNGADWRVGKGLLKGLYLG